MPEVQTSNGGMGSFSGSNIAATDDHRWYWGAYFQDDWKAEAGQTAVLVGNVGVLTGEIEITTPLWRLRDVAFQIIDLKSGFESMAAEFAPSVFQRSRARWVLLALLVVYSAVLGGPGMVCCSARARTRPR